MSHIQLFPKNKYGTNLFFFFLKTYGTNFCYTEKSEGTIFAKISF